MRGDEDGVLGQRRVVAVGHVDVEVGPGRGIVPKGQRAVLVQQPRRFLDGRYDSGHVACRREGSDQQIGLDPALQGVPHQLLLEMLQVEPALARIGGVFRNDNAFAA